MSTIGSLVIGLLLIFVPAARADVPFRTVALSGDAVPGIPETGNFLSFDTPVINNNGTVAFHAVINGPGINSSNEEGMWVENGSSLDLIARRGDTAPDSAGQKYYYLLGPLLGDDGKSAFTGIYSNGSSAGVFASAPGTTRLVARNGEPAPGLPDGVLLATPMSSDSSVISEPAVNASGQTAFYSHLSGLFGSNVGLWSEGSGSLSLVTRQGASAPGTASGVTFSSFGSGAIGSGTWPAFNDDGKTAFAATLAGPGVGISNSQGIWSEASGSLSLVVRGGNGAPGTEPGVTFHSSFSDPIINNRGDVLFQDLLQGPGVSSSNNSGLWLADAGGTVGLVARKGSSAPTMPAGVNWGDFDVGSLRLGGSGAATFSSSLSGPSIDASNNSSAWLFAGDQFHLIAREGDPATGLEAGVLFGDSLSLYSINRDDLVVFGAKLTGSGVGSANDYALYSRDSSGVFRLIVREGDLIEVSPGIFKTVQTYGASFSDGNEDGHHRSLNEQGDYVFGLRFTDGTRGLFVATIPEPATLVLWMFGACLLRRSRPTIRKS